MKNSNTASNNKNLKADNEALKAIVTELQKIVVGLEATLTDKNVDINLLTEQLNLFKALLHARRSEKKLAGKVDQRQMSLFDEAEATPPEEADEASTEQTPAEETTSVAGSLLAYIILGKFADALPLYRQSKIFERLGIYISRSTMSGWMILAADACKPLIALMHKNVQAGSIINMDETPVQVMREAGRANTSKSYMWITCGGRDGPIRLFHYAPSRAGGVAKELLGDFKGFLQTDGYAGYTAIGRKYHIKHVGCLVHLRRKFIEVNKGNSKNKPGLAKSILDDIAEVYKWEKMIRSRTLTPDKILAIRSKKVEPLLAGMLKLMTEARDSIPPKTLLGIAVKYALGQWEHIANYLLNLQLTPDNNIAENAIRPFVIGRKNWLFSGSPRGAESSAILYSLIETAKANKLNPQSYLLHVFEKIPLADTPEKLEAILPWNCTETINKP